MEDNILDFSGAKLEDFNKGVQDVQAASVDTGEPTGAAIGDPDASAGQVTPDAGTQDTPAPPAAEPPKSEPVREYQFKDDFIKGVVEFYEKTGDITPYLQAKTLDFAAMSDEDIMRRDLREQYSDLSEKAFEKLYKQQVVDKFKLDIDEWSEDDSELGRELLKNEASKIRSKYIDWQNGFKAPEQVVDNSIQEAVEKFQNEVKSNSVTKSILDSKRIPIKVGDAEFQFEVPNAESLLDMTIDNDKFFNQFVAQDNQLDYAKWYKTAAYSQNPELFEKALINYGKTLGREEITKDLKNPSSAQVGGVPTEASGDFTSGLLNAFATRGISK